MKKFFYYNILGLILFFSGSCSLDVDPQGTLNDDQVNSPEQVEKLVIAAYAANTSDHYNYPFSLWPYGDVRSEDAYKGGRNENDINTYHFYEISQNIVTTASQPDNLWYRLYISISRANATLKVLNSMDSNQFEKRDIRIAEMKFLRAHNYFCLKILFKNVPFIDETVELADYESISNVALDNDALWQKIIDDFQFAYNHLPENQLEIGRPNKYAAAAYLAKTRLYKAYRQDEMHNVTDIDKTDLEEVVKYTDIVMGSSYKLEEDFGFNFLPGEFENGRESVFAFQYSHNDLTINGNLNWGDVLSVPQGVGCCDFKKPSQNLVNAFKTKNGLPMFEDFDKNNYDTEKDESDPRLFHTVAIPGFPYKYNVNNIYEDSWNRNPGVYGYFASLKENVDPECECFKHYGSFYGNSKNRIIIRYADVLLMKAEALIELNRESESISLINEVRRRAAQSTMLIEYAPNLRVQEYKNGENCVWNNEFARKALRWERRLEFAMESSRFFDLVRWGIADQVLNAYYKSEAARASYYSGATFTKNKNEYMPIPQQQINFSKGIYIQNYGWS